MSDPTAEQNTPRERRTALLLFLATLCSVFLVYGYFWTDGDPLADRDTAIDSAQFAVTLLGILLAHEMGHYLVALRHGFRLSLPYFLPVPLAFGTFGAIIRLRSLPSSRTALLEMGAAGPLAGFAVALLAIAIGLPGTVEHLAPQVIWVPPPTDLPPAAPPGTFELALTWLLSHPPLSWISPPTPAGTLPMLILANPPIMDLLGELINGAAPGRYATLSPVAMAGWVGCLLTGINLLPIGQLDGGHVLNALLPRQAPRIARIGLVLAILAGVFWSGWAVWALLLLALRAWMSLPVPEWPALTRRARLIALAALGAFLLSFMPRPLVVDDVPFGDIDWVDPSGQPVTLPPGAAGAQALDETRP